MSLLRSCLSAHFAAKRRQTRLVAERLEQRLTLDAGQLDPNGELQGLPESLQTVPEESFRFFLSDRGIGEGPAVENPTINMEVGETKTLYIWMQIPDGFGLYGAGVTLASATSGVLAPMSVSVYEPEPGDRWSIYLPNPAPEFGGLGDYLGQAAAGTLSPRIMTSDVVRMSDPSYDPITKSLLFATLTVQAADVGETEIFMEVGSAAIAPWNPGSYLLEDTPIHFGVGDEAVSGVEVRATGPLADARIVVSGSTSAAQTVDDRYQFVVFENDVVEVAATDGVLANDAVSDAAIVELVAGPKLGTVELSADGSFRYAVPNPDRLYFRQRQRLELDDAFVYRVVETDGTSRLTRVEVRLLPGLLAVDDYLTHDPRFERELTLFGRLYENDRLFTQETDPYRLDIVTPPANGTISFEWGGLGAYVPDLGFRGRDQFTYRLSDGRTTSEATVYIDVSLNNLPPQAVDDDLLVFSPRYVEDLLLANDTDPDGDRLSVTTIRIVDPPKLGSLWLLNGAVLYSAAPGYSGNDSFSYVVSDGLEESRLATAFVHAEADLIARADLLDLLTGTPVAHSDQISVAANHRCISLAELLRNDLDENGDRPYVFSNIEIVTLPRYGTLVRSGFASMSYSPNADFVGDDSFEYRVRNGELVSNPAIVSLDVDSRSPDVAGCFSAPTSEDDEFNVSEGQIELDQGLLTANDLNSFGEPVNFWRIGIDDWPQHGQLVIEGRKVFYIAEHGFSGTDSFSYTITDEHGSRSAPAAVFMHVSPFDEPAATESPFPVDLGLIGFPVNIELPYVVGFPFPALRPADGFGYDVPHILPNVDHYEFQHLVFHHGNGQFLGNDAAQVLAEIPLEIAVNVPAEVAAEPALPAVARRRALRAAAEGIDADAADLHFANSDLSAGSRAERRAMRRGRRAS